MRDIKFRAWDSRNNEMVYSSETDCFYINTKGVLFMYAIPKSESGLEVVYHKSYEVDQYTGLKDKNGVEIYEGDILKFKWLYQDYSVYIEDKWLYGKVEFVGGKFIVRRYCSTFDIGDINQMTFERFWRESYSSAKNEYFKMIGFEVVSNIHENPELLK